MVSKTGYPEPLAKRALARKRYPEAIEGVTGAASGSVQEALLAASVADCLPHTFQEASGSIVGTILTSVLIGPPGIDLSPTHPCEPQSHAGEAICSVPPFFSTLSFGRCLLRAPSEI